jgi:hypothetical protein
VGSYLLRQGLLAQAAENSTLNLESMEEGAMEDLIGHSITYRIAVGANQGCKAFKVRTKPTGSDELGQAQTPVCCEIERKGTLSVNQLND